MLSSKPDGTQLVRASRSRRVSGKITACWLFCCMLLTAVLIPMTLRLPVWIEYEVVLAVWWFIWFVALTILLFKGLRISDDHVLHQPRNWLAGNRLLNQKKDTSSSQNKRSSLLEYLPLGYDAGSADGCLFLILFVGAVVILLFGIWVLIEVAIPAILFLTYFVTRGMVALAANDRRQCRGRFGKSILWGFIWATAYSAPLVLAVWFVHFAYQRMQAGIKPLPGM